MGLDEHMERRLIWLMGGRLVLATLSLVLAAGIDGFGRDLSDEARTGLYWTITFAFFATVISGSTFGRIRRPRRFVIAQIAMDVGIVSLLVHFSGGRVSVFTFLYVLVILYSSLLFERRIALATATMSAIAYGCALVSANQGWGLALEEGTAAMKPSLLLALWCVHGGALFLVGALASVLSGELQRTGAALDRSTSDLRMLSDLHQRTIDCIMSGVLTTDSDGSITSFNPEAERITGYRLEEVMGLELEEIIPGAWRTIADDESTAAQGPGRARLSYRNARGEELFLGLAGSILRGEDGAALGDIVIFQDVTQVVAMETKLRRSERLAAVGELSAKIAHEVRNPLASISGSIQILHADLAATGLDSEPAQLMDIVVRETDRLNRLITDFLQYARPSPMQQESVDLVKLMDELIRMLEPVVTDEIRIHVDVAEGLHVMADASQLQQILWNLSLNAIQAMEKGGRLVIMAQGRGGEFPQGPSRFLRSGNEEGTSEGPAQGARSNAIGDGSCAEIELAISDTGPGIAPEFQDRIFEPFYTTKREGTGLGLSTVHRIVENHGGELQLLSEVGRGTTFRIRLPGEEL